MKEAPTQRYQRADEIVTGLQRIGCRSGIAPYAAALTLVIALAAMGWVGWSIWPALGGPEPIEDSGTTAAASPALITDSATSNAPAGRGRAFKFQNWPRNQRR